MLASCACSSSATRRRPPASRRAAALTEDGRETARALGKQLAADGSVPTRSPEPAARARQTADEIAKAVGGEAEPDERLAPGARR